VGELPDWSQGPKADAAGLLQFIKAAGFRAVQTRDPEAAHAAGLTPTSLRRVDVLGDAMAIATGDRDRGYDCTTLHVGTGFEEDDLVRALIDSINEASAATGHPLYVETHRATVTQDMKRTLDIVRACPNVRFNGDFSHWYTGAEMNYGDLDAKIGRLEPVLERTRFIHGRISSPGAIQIPVQGGNETRHVAVFRKFWTCGFWNFLRTAGPGDYFCFYPELLSPSYFYARLIHGGKDGPAEETDRWLEALELVRIARACWQDAVSGGGPA
jgi:hypothetical protein